MTAAGETFLRLLVEVRGFEPLTPAVRRQCSTGLSYTPGTAPG
jgi:hypothetical protein